jgi:UDP-N-acetyl-D-mannosaminuronate dehydrogenase
MTKVLVVGYKGKVGSALFEILRGKSDFQVSGIDIADKDKVSDIKDVDIMHICYGCHDEQEFIENTIGYIRKFNPALTIINSTVAPTVTENIFQKTGKLIVHSPTRGMYPYMKHDLLHFVKFIGGINRKASDMAKQHFESLGIKTYVCKSPRETEFAKLFATSYYALLIAWFQEMHRICKENNVEYSQVVDFIKTEEDKPILQAGYIGGECLIPNIRLLLKKCDSKFLHAILESNERWKPTPPEKQVRGTIRKDSWRFEKQPH